MSYVEPYQQCMVNDCSKKRVNDSMTCSQHERYLHRVDHVPDENPHYFVRVDEETDSFIEITNRCIYDQDGEEPRCNNPIHYIYAEIGMCGGHGEAETQRIYLEMK